MGAQFIVEAKVIAFVKEIEIIIVSKEISSRTLFVMVLPFSQEKAGYSFLFPSSGAAGYPAGDITQSGRLLSS